MKEGYKQSIYNYIHTDKSGDLLLCNFAKGPSSFCKIHKEDKKILEAVFSGSSKIESKVYNVLIDKGILVHSEEDEYAKVRALYYDYVYMGNLTLILMPTEQCNFRCRYCYEKFEKFEMSQSLQNAVIKFVQKNAHRYPGITISWFGGEPLLEMDIVERMMSNIIHIGKQKKIPVISSMTTNAYELSPDVFDRLYNLNVHEYQITLDGLRESHDKQRILQDGTGTFDKIVENLLYIRDSGKYPKAKIQIRVNVTCMVLKNLDKFLEFFKNQFSKDRRFSLYMTAAWSPAQEGGFELELQNQYLEANELQQYLIDHGVYVTDINLAGIWNLFVPMGGLCYASRRNSFVIGSDGKIYKCTVNFDMVENNIGYLEDNGNIHEDDFLHSKWYLDRINMKKMCKQCFLFPVCFGAACPPQTKFIEDYECVMATSTKKHIGTYLEYLANNYSFDVITLEKVGDSDGKCE